jgi:hypothetical protein
VPFWDSLRGVLAMDGAPNPCDPRQTVRLCSRCDHAISAHTREDLLAHHLVVIPSKVPEVSQEPFIEVMYYDGSRMLTSMAMLRTFIDLRSRMLDLAALDQHIVTNKGHHNSVLDILFGTGGGRSVGAVVAPHICLPDAAFPSACHDNGSGGEARRGHNVHIGELHDREPQKGSGIRGRHGLQGMASTVQHDAHKGFNRLA